MRAVEHISLNEGVVEQRHDIVLKAKSADPPDGGHTLTKADETTLYIAACATAVLRAPRIVLGLGCGAEYDCQD
jgi:hypothetical protein